jgi:hypothetical protein
MCNENDLAASRGIKRNQTGGGSAMTATKPKFGSALDGYWGSDNGVHVNFFSIDSHVNELYIRPCASWVDNNLTALA